MASTKPTFFFSATQSVDDRLGAAFTFIWANYAGLRELWWQVRGFTDQFPELHIKEVEQKFLSGLPMPGGIDFNQAFLKAEWRVHEQEFSKWLLFECCTLYEGWAEKVCHDLFPKRKGDIHAKNLQFNFESAANPGYKAVITDANSNISPIMEKELLPTLKLSKLNCWSQIDAHLTAYSYFKKCRNSIIHSDGLCTQSILDSRAKIISLQSMHPSPFKNNFTLPPQELNKKINLDLRDCVIFGTIARKLICTFDAALSVASRSEEIMESRLRSLSSKNEKWKNLPSNPIKYEQRIHRMLSAAKIPEPQSLSNFILWMKSKKII
ncbi:hypothetical protein AAHH43_003168 [Pseudomonas aeruginosa]|uniref:hypothetical protein n=1 Tax=Pseudomonas aeruginosa TaxID=287 RepID=UPI00124861B4|nr:hypothetical protein [Pseudomonas aeruginosa]KAB0734551.1 hypothetical protein F7O88_21605 [Pseudomonas aeruginosa]MCW5427204.1 hypothetical protein [Pseudomonas aeruginosa]MCW5435296.1 hypothetical protein [Pseudomonas aeruginosa]QHI62750.1 hypothetical protein GQS72_03250 [Pseudomonas aeruginosa]